MDSFRVMIDKSNLVYPQIRIRGSESMDSFRVMIDKSNQVYPQIRIRESSHFKKVQFISIWKDSYTIPASLY
jgi:hypothetical protein